ncbi:MAG: response regulator [Desulfobacteraceae bacterium]|nr:MAG: response regulator [Desulfobacteraceae bacterium]
MSVVTVFSGIFCREDHVVQRLLASTGYKLVDDENVVAEASRLSGMSESKIGRSFSARTSVFNKFTHEKESSIAHLRLALAQMLSDDNFLINGFVGHLVPEEVRHALRVCLIADVRFRTTVAKEAHGLSEKEGIKLIRKHDDDCAAWANTLFEEADPWNASLYDIVIPMDKIGVEGAATLIEENLGKDVVKPTTSSKKAVEDFLIAARAEAALAKEGHSVAVSAKDGSVTLTINKHVLMLSRLEEELKAIVDNVPGVTSVVTKVGKDFHRSDIYRKHDFEVPSKVLLVDDEREFVQTLSERLMMRDMGSAVAYDGESALHLINEDEPEVMLLDLKMPGIDGLEVLRRVKDTRPEIEVIILTGHGSEADKEQCMELGAFAYLQKPLDIDVLSETIREANEKIRKKKASKT